MAYPIAWAQAALAKYGPTIAGLIIGTLAKYGLALSEGRRLTWRGIVADLFLLGMLGLIAVLVSDWFALKGDARVLAGALAAVSSDRLVRLVRDRMLAAADRKLVAALNLPPDEPIEISAEGPNRVVARVMPDHTATMRSELRQAFPPTMDADPVADHLLNKLS